MDDMKRTNSFNYKYPKISIIYPSKLKFLCILLIKSAVLNTFEVEKFLKCFDCIVSNISKSSDIINDILDEIFLLMTNNVKEKYIIFLICSW